MDVVETIRDLNPAQHQDLKSAQAQYAPLNGKLPRKTARGASAANANAETKDESDTEPPEVHDQLIDDAMLCNGGGNGYSEHTHSALSTSTAETGLTSQPDLQNGLGIDFSSVLASLLSEVRAQSDAHRSEVSSFKSAVTSSLLRIRSDCDEQQQLVRRLQRDVNSAVQDKKKQRAQRDKQIRAKDNEIKAMKSKYNETRSELTRSKQSVDKVRDEAKLKVEALLRKVEKLEHDKAALAQKVQRAQDLLEAERVEKSKVKANNAEYLRTEKLKIARQLEKEQARTRRLENRVGGLEEEVAAKTSDNKQRATRLKQAEERSKRQETERSRAHKERAEALQSLHRKNEEMKAQRNELDDTLAKIEELRLRDVNQKSEIKQLHEAVRRKSEREKQFDEIRKRLSAKERKLEEREKEVGRRLRQAKGASGGGRRSQGSHGGGQARRQMAKNGDGDPLGKIRNVFPWHWISIVLLFVLMVAIAQKNGRR